MSDKEDKPARALNKTVKQTKTVFVTLSAGIKRWWTVERLLGPIRKIGRFGLVFRLGKKALSVSGVTLLGWGRRPGTEVAVALANQHNFSYLVLEDGFLRSYGTGEHFPPLSLVQDRQGIYYDSRGPTDLEALLNSDADVLGVSHTTKSSRMGAIDLAFDRVVHEGLSKYNHARPWDIAERSRSSETRPCKHVLVVDQTQGDMSVVYGGATAETFEAMLEAALSEYPEATVFVKTHPEVTSGRKAGYLSSLLVRSTRFADNPRIIPLREDAEPASLIRVMDHVYVVSSTMGFEALMHGKPVTCFGIPWYAGWGVTDDRQRCARRTRKRTVKELFAAAYYSHVEDWESAEPAEPEIVCESVDEGRYERGHVRGDDLGCGTTDGIKDGYSIFPDPAVLTTQQGNQENVPQNVSQAVLQRGDTTTDAPSIKAAETNAGMHESCHQHVQSGLRNSPGQANQPHRRHGSYTTYINPVTHSPGSIHDAIDWLVHQKRMGRFLHGDDGKGRVFVFGFQRWKAYNLRSMLALKPDQLIFVGGISELRAKSPVSGDTVMVWGADVPEDLVALVHGVTGLRILHVEDGFLRSVGLGSDMIKPQSLVFDERGLYFDARQPSDLEHLLQNAVFSDEDLARAADLRRLIVEHGLTKYNLDVPTGVNWQIDDAEARRVIFVPGQVEDDASIRYGCVDVRTNLDLLKAVRATNPEAWIVFKPHPDVVTGNRAGRVRLSAISGLVDHVELEASVISCLLACDEVHTMTSLTGFDALLRGKRVVTYGQPFYAGWGLTEDRCVVGVGDFGNCALTRRTRRLSLDELVAGVLLKYPVYWDWNLRGFTTCEAVINRLIEERDGLMASGRLKSLRDGASARLMRKAKVLVRAWTSRM